MSTVLSYSPQLQLNLQRSNFAGLEDEDAASSNHDNGPAGTGPDPDHGVAAEAEDSRSEAAASGVDINGSSSKAAAATRAPAMANGRRASGRLPSAGGRLDWRLGPPERLCAEADQLEGLGHPSAFDPTQVRGSTVAGPSAEDRAFFGIVGHLYASARVELIRLADALSLQSSFSPTKRASSGAMDSEQVNGFTSPARPSREPGSSLNWLSPMRLPISPTQTAAAITLPDGQRDADPAPPPALVPPPLPPLPASAQTQQRPDSATAPGQPRPPSRLRHASSADAVSIDAVRWCIIYLSFGHSRKKRFSVAGHHIDMTG